MIQIKERKRKERESKGKKEKEKRQINEWMRPTKKIGLIFNKWR